MKRQRAGLVRFSPRINRDPRRRLRLRTLRLGVAQTCPGASANGANCPAHTSCPSAISTCTLGNAGSSVASTPTTLKATRGAFQARRRRDARRDDDVAAVNHGADHPANQQREPVCADWYDVRHAREQRLAIPVVVGRPEAGAGECEVLEPVALASSAPFRLLRPGEGSAIGGDSVANTGAAGGVE